MNKKEKNFKCLSINFNNIFSDIETGKLKIPTFQRDYVWEQKQIVSLLNSIMENTPLGTIVTWETNEELDCRNEIIEKISNKPSNHFSYVIDGQQRITTLSTIWFISRLKNEKEIWKKISIKFTKISFDVDKKEFVCLKKNDFIESKHIPLFELFNSNNRDSYENRRNFINNKKIDMNFIDDWGKILLKFQSYNISIIELNENYDLDDAILIFEKINTKGIKLSIFNIINAKWQNITFRNEKKLLEDIFNDFNSNKIKLVENDTLLDSLFLTIKNRENKPITKSKDKIDYKYSENVNLIDETIEKWFLSAERASDFLINDMKFSNKTLPSTNIFKWVVYLFYKNKSKDLTANQRENIKKYIYLLCINNFYEKSTQEKLIENINFINEGLENDFNNLSKVKLKTKIDDSAFLDLSSGNDMTAKLITSILSHEAFDFKLGKKTTNTYELHHIFPKNGYKNLENYNDIRSLIDSYANLTPIDDKTNKDIKNKAFSKYTNEYLNDNNNLEATLETHFIDYKLFKNDSNIDNIKIALEDRSKKLAKKINDLLLN